ncbi:MAG: hypothetical protein EXS18_00140 [Verrucomicrobiae bacterium]|nr:hypothetical protein [Verrucomicrobiae bacterium]
MKTNICILFAISLTLGSAAAQEFNRIEYLCADWGPSMTLPTKEGETPQFSDTGEEIYFLKQLTHVRREKLAVPDLLTGSKTREAWSTRGIYLCKMKPDGSEKMEIKELWHDMAYPIDTQGQSTWMNVNEKTRKIALSITYAGSDLLGLWTMNLDGSELKRIIGQGNGTNEIGRANHPSWTPDGQWIVFEESSRISKCDAAGKKIDRLTEGPKDREPSVSPDGTRIAYIHWIKWASRLYLMNLDGSDQHPLPNPDDKRWGTHGGTWPAWSPDGKKIYFIGVSDTIVEVLTGKILWTGGASPYTTGWPHWGKTEFIGHFVGGIVRTDPQTWQSQLVGPSRSVECNARDKSQCKW